MGHGKGKSASYCEPPPAPVPIPDYNVTGDIWPDARCNYFYAGTYDDKPYYSRGGAWFLWWDGPGGEWHITAILGEDGPGYWYSRHGNLVDVYDPGGEYAGIATVAAGPHTPLVADYHVAGDIEPNAVCNYSVEGAYNDKPYYRRNDGAWSIWWDAEDEWWIISQAPGDFTRFWVKYGDPMTGEYEPGSEVTGNPTVLPGPH